MMLVERLPSSVILNLSVRFSPRVRVPFVKMWKATSDLSLCMLVMNRSRNVADSTFNMRTVNTP